MKRYLLIALLLLTSLPLFSQQYVDLGLPSGTLWKSSKEAGSYTFDDALRNYGGFIPSSGQFRELLDNCTWKWAGKGYKVYGKNMKYIFLATEAPENGEAVGGYWSCTRDGGNGDGVFGLLIFHFLNEPDRIGKIDRTRTTGNKRFVILCK